MDRSLFKKKNGVFLSRDTRCKGMEIGERAACTGNCEVPPVRMGNGKTRSKSSRQW